MNLDRRIANAVKRLHAHIDLWAISEQRNVVTHGESVRRITNESFNHAARSIGQTRRWSGYARSV